MSKKMTQVGAAWKKTTRDGGKEFLSVNITNPTGPDIQLSIWPNSYKEKEGQPDFIVYKSADERPAVQSAQRTASAFPSDADEQVYPSDSDSAEIPF